MGVNGFAAVVCAVVVVVFAVAEFTQGAWVVVVVMPILDLRLVRTNRQYRARTSCWKRGRPSRHVKRGFCSVTWW